MYTYIADCPWRTRPTDHADLAVLPRTRRLTPLNHDHGDNGGNLGVLANWSPLSETDCQKVIT